MNTPPLASKLKHLARLIISNHELKLTWALAACGWLGHHFLGESSPIYAPLMAGLFVLAVLVAKTSHDLDDELWIQADLSFRTRRLHSFRNTDKITLDYRPLELRRWRRRSVGRQPVTPDGAAVSSTFTREG